MIGMLKLRNMSCVLEVVGGSGVILRVGRLGRGDDDVSRGMDMNRMSLNGGVDHMELGNLVVQDRRMMIGVKEVVVGEGVFPSLAIVVSNLFVSRDSMVIKVGHTLLTSDPYTASLHCPQSVPPSSIIHLNLRM